MTQHNMDVKCTCGHRKGNHVITMVEGADGVGRKHRVVGACAVKFRIMPDGTSQVKVCHCQQFTSSKGARA